VISCEQSPAQIPSTKNGPCQPLRRLLLEILDFFLRLPGLLTILVGILFIYKEVCAVPREWRDDLQRTTLQMKAIFDAIHALRTAPAHENNIATPQPDSPAATSERTPHQNPDLNQTTGS